MHFIIDADTGDQIVGWLAPDNPSQTPKFIISIPGRDEIEISANRLRADIRDFGLHSTGQCGFCIGPDIVPDLAHLPDLEIIEGDNHLPIYRRLQPDHVERKIFLFDCTLIPQRRILQEIKNRFSLSYFNSERNGLETTIALIANPFCKSIFISGRSLLLRYNDLLKEKGYLRMALLREPHEELAERLYFLNFLVKEGSADSSYAGYTTGVKSLLEFAANLPFNDQKALTSAFRGTTELQRRELMSPMTKVFGCDVDEMPKNANVSRALDALADFDVVGTRERFPLFKDLVTAAAGGANIFGDEEPVFFQSVKTLAESLAKIGIVNDLLADDLALFKYVDEAIGESLSDPDMLMQGGNGA